jgi:hypothetical protein
LSRSRRRAGLGAAIALSVPLALSGCGAGEDAQTQQVYSPADGVRADQGTISVINALVVRPAAAGGESPAAETPTPGAEGETPAAEGGEAVDGVLSVTIANRSGRPDTFTGLQAQELTDASVDGPTEVPPGGVLRIGTGTATDQATTVTLRGLKARPGGSVALRFSFAQAGVLEVKVPVVQADGIYASLTPSAPAVTSPAATSPSP